MTTQLDFAHRVMSPLTDLRENRPFAFELKFVVNPSLAGQISDWARARLAPDPNASGEANDAYRISSLYFDTNQFDVYYRRGSFGRSKYRIRRYGDGADAFLERKLKTRGLVSKRRTVVKLDDLERLADSEPDGGWIGHWYHRRLLARRLQPVCQISYRRTARVSTTGHGPIRLTLDDGIRARPVSGLVFNDRTEAGVSLSENQVIIELKYRGEMPVLFKLLVEEFALNPQPISKYRLAALALGCVHEPIPHLPEQVRLETSLCLSF